MDLGNEHINGRLLAAATSTGKLDPARWTKSLWKPIVKRYGFHGVAGDAEGLHPTSLVHDR